MLLSASLHIFVGLKRTWDQKLSSGVWSGELNLAIAGLMLLTFMTIHLLQFRFADTEQYFCALRQPLSIGTKLVDHFEVLLDRSRKHSTGARQRHLLEQVHGIEKSCVVRILYHGGRHLHHHACLGWGKLTLAPSFWDSQEASLRCQVVRIPHFLGDRFDVHFFQVFVTFTQCV